jgi:hypothetical protein
MANTLTLFEQALLAEASYADLIGTENNPDLLKTRLIAQDGDDYDFSPIQASEFVTYWRVVTHQADTSSGFSAFAGVMDLFRASLGVLDHDVGELAAVIQPHF